MHVKELSKCTTKNELRNALELLPSDLHGIYNATLGRIEAQEKTHAFLAIRAIIWLTHAHRSLKIMELQHALAVQLDSNIFDKDDITPPELIVSLSCGLIVVDEKSKIVRLAREYFLGKL